MLLLRPQRKLLILCCLFPLILNAQNLVQTLRGTVIDRGSGASLSDINIQLLDTNYGVATGEDGTFRLSGIPVGRYILRATAVSYDTLIIAEVLLEAGKETLLQLEMTPRSSLLNEVVITGQSNPFPNDYPSMTLLTQEATIRYPATFYDPARLMLTRPGVASQNDQTNGIVVRGNSPNGILWRLEGADIVNPNHTPNAGTFSDQVTQNGGGVNMLSAQLLSTSAFFNGAFPTEYGNALSGVLDMRFRPGNEEKTEYTAQLGLIGLDLAMEGPFRKNSRASYLVNARYSTIGILSALGVDLGDEEINFADLSFNLNFPFKKGGQFTVFGVAGNSENIFEAERDSSLWEFQKDGQDIRFESQTMIAGATLNLPVGEKSNWRTVFAASKLQTDRVADLLDTEYLPQAKDAAQNDQSKISLHSTFKYAINPENQLKIGAAIVRQDFDLLTIRDQSPVARGSGGGFLLQPYVNWQSRLSAKLQFNAGMRYSRFTFNGSDAIEPRASLQFRMDKDQSLRLAYGLHSQLQLPQLYYAVFRNSNNEQLGLSKAHHFVLAYEKQLNLKTRLTAELYYQDLFDIAVRRDAATDFSAINLLEGFVREPLANDGTGRNYGFELGLEKYFNGDFFYLSNISIYQSKYTASDGVERDTRFAGNYTFNFTGGKEWTKQKDNGKYRTWGLNLRVVSLGGFRESPIDIQASLAQQTTIFEEGAAFSISQAGFFRTDLRIYLKKAKPGRNGMWALDIQNLSNQENLAFRYFDTAQGQVVNQYQLGIIPILSYRISY